MNDQSDPIEATEAALSQQDAMRATMEERMGVDVNPRPRVGQMVHYVSYGTPGGEYTSRCRAAVIAQVGDTPDPNTWMADLAVLNPSGMFFNEDTPQDDRDRTGGSWHYPLPDGSCEER